MRLAFPGGVQGGFLGSRPDELALKIGLDTDLSRPFVVGAGSVLILRGWCFHPTRDVRSLEILVDGSVRATAEHGLARMDVLRQHLGSAAEERSLTSGFVARIPFPRIAAPTRVELSVRTKLHGSRVAASGIGSVELVPGTREPIVLPSAVASRPDAPLVAICLATYRPPIDLLEIQLDSILAQTHRNWICIINDDASPRGTWERIQQLASRDPRFVAFRNTERLGFYRNFERAMERVPDAADYVALCDQDDAWYPEKLSTCLAEFTADTQLVYCDMDIVARDGRPMARTYWTTRRNNYEDFETLLYANTVTGAASVFRAGLLRDVLPFPERVGDAFHDHWIACAAMARGRLGYVDRPLYAYRQHGSNVLGHCTPEPTRVAKSARTLLRFVLGGGAARGEAKARLHHLDVVFKNDLGRIAAIAQTLALRLPDAPRTRRRVLRRFEHIDASLLGLTIQGLKYELMNRASLGAEWHCLKGAVGHRLFHGYYRADRAAVVRRTAAAEAAGEPAGATQRASEVVESLERKIAPLALNVSDRHPRRVNFLIPTIDFRYFFGGYIGKFNLALRLQRAGLNVRMVTVDPCHPNLPAWKRLISEYQGLESFFDEVEVQTAYDRSLPLDVNPRDSFIASTWWTAHVAHAAIRALGRERFLYLIQEYEPMTFAMGSYFALADETYTYPHQAVFSTELLRTYFRENRLGVYREGVEVGDARSAAFQNAINQFQVTEAGLRTHPGRRLVFYARPEAHAARNMFEVGAIALRRVAERGLLDGWTIHGLGSVGGPGRVELGSGLELELQPRTGLQEYLERLPSYDVGLALMLTPHPSLVPLDMAAAGLVTVTNTYATKTAARLVQLSSNLVPVPPTVEGVTAGIAEATARAADLPARVAGSRVAWATDWRDALDDQIIARVREFLEQ